MAANADVMSGMLRVRLEFSKPVLVTTVTLIGSSFALFESEWEEYDSGDNRVRYGSLTAYPTAVWFRR